MNLDELTAIQITPKFTYLHQNILIPPFYRFNVLTF